MTFGSFDTAEAVELDLSIAMGQKAVYPATDLVAAFDIQVNARPEAVALEWNGGMLRYRELDQLARNLAGQLLEDGAKAGEFIGIEMARESSWIVGLLAILRAGCGYLPLNFNDPAARREMLVRDADIKRILVKTDQGDEIAIKHTKIEGVVQDHGDFKAGCPAYVMYTSGSTGVPKGVTVSHKNVLRLVRGDNAVPLSPQTRMLQTGAATFDAVTFEIWGTLLNGGCLILCDETAILSAPGLADEILKHRANTMWLTSPLFSVLAGEDPAIFEPLAYLIVGGDVVVRKHVDSVFTQCPNLVLVNGYGPTENTTFSTMHTIARDARDANVPIGKPIANSSAYILDDQGQLVAKGTRGELYLGGDGVALGYLNRPEQTGQSFLKDPFLQNRIMYRTGDLAEMLPDGTVVFHGRADTQVKLRGYRIELGEIENCLRNHPLVSDAVLIYDKSCKAGPRLLAYVVADAVVTDMDIREYLAAHLPHYMIPHIIVPLDEFPLTPHGKIAKRELPAPETLDYLGAEYAAPETRIEKEIARIISETVGLKAIGLKDSFFDLGMDSLSAARVAAAINKTLGTDLPAKVILTNPSLENLCARVKVGDVSKDSGGLIQKDKGSRYIHKFALTKQQSAIYTEQVKSPNSIRYNVPVIVPLPTDIDLDRFERAILEWVERHDILRLSIPLADPLHQVVNDHQKTDVPRFDCGPELKTTIRPFDIHNGPLWRVSLHHDQTGWQAFFDFHHLIVDGQTLGLLLGDLDKLYRGEPCDEITHHLSDVVVWETEGEGRRLRDRQRDFWKGRKLHISKSDTLPLDFSRTADRTRKGQSLKFSFDAGLAAQCKSRAVRLRLTLAEFLGGVYGLFLMRATGQEMVTFGTPAHMRHASGFENVCGMLANTVCIGIDAAAQMPLNDYLQQASLVFRQSLEHQAFTFNDLVELTGASGSGGRNPLFDTLFAFQMDKDLTTDFLGEQVSLRPFSPGEAMFDLNLQLFQTQAGIDAEWEYDASLFVHETIEALRDIFVDLLEQVSGGTENTTIADCLSETTAESQSDVAIEYGF
jgi:amino acid adenylation domain-containing protein